MALFLLLLLFCSMCCTFATTTTAISHILFVSWTGGFSWTRAPMCATSDILTRTGSSNKWSQNSQKALLWWAKCWSIDWFHIHTGIFCLSCSYRKSLEGRRERIQAEYSFPFSKRRVLISDSADSVSQSLDSICSPLFFLPVPFRSAVNTFTRTLADEFSVLQSAFARKKKTAKRRKEDTALRPGLFFSSRGNCWFILSFFFVYYFLPASLPFHRGGC